MLPTPHDVTQRLAARVRADRLARGWTQAELAARAGVSLPTYRVFERTGQISLERLLAIASALGRLAEWDALFAPRPVRSLDDLVPERPPRQRGRPRRVPRGTGL